jgi:hypothetical protein
MDYTMRPSHFRRQRTYMARGSAGEYQANRTPRYLTYLTVPSCLTSREHRTRPVRLPRSILRKRAAIMATVSLSFPKGLADLLVSISWKQATLACFHFAASFCTVDALARSMVHAAVVIIREWAEVTFCTVVTRPSSFDSCHRSGYNGTDEDFRDPKSWCSALLEVHAMLQSRGMSQFCSPIQ